MSFEVILLILEETLKGFTKEILKTNKHLITKGYQEEHKKYNDGVGYQNGKKDIFGFINGIQKEDNEAYCSDNAVTIKMDQFLTVCKPNRTRNCYEKKRDNKQYNGYRNWKMRW